VPRRAGGRKNAKKKTATGLAGLSPRSLAQETGTGDELLSLWAYRRGVTLDFSPPGQPTGNALRGAC
jgi:hypothetical protein